MAKEILIGDSDKGNQKEFQKIFGATDYHLVFSESGEDVLLRVRLFRPDLIIADTALSEKNGYEVCEAIKEDPDFRSIPFILLLNMFEELSDQDRHRLKADGVLSRPLRHAEVLTMVDRLLRGVSSEEERGPQKRMELETFADMGEERYGSRVGGGGGGGGEEEEIIDLLDVVEETTEEPEPKMSIDDFIVSERAEPFGEVGTFDSWEKLDEAGKVTAEEGLILSIDGEGEKVEDFPYKLKQEASPRQESQEEELFEKIELEDILERVGTMELPSEREGQVQTGDKPLKPEGMPLVDVEEKPFAFDEFEMALKSGVETELTKPEAPEEKTLPRLFTEEMKEEIRGEAVSFEKPAEEKREGGEAEEFPKELLEEMLKEEELKHEALVEEEALVGEELEEELIEEGLQEEKFFEEEELFEKGGLPEEELLEEEKPLEEETLEIVKGLEEEEKTELFEGLEAPEVSAREKSVIEEVPRGMVTEEGTTGASRFFETGVTSPLRRMEQQVEDVISEKVQGMMEEFITKHVPEMTKEVVQLTLERIEKMVREIVPDLAEKMIEEEIRRLEKGETE